MNHTSSDDLHDIGVGDIKVDNISLLPVVNIVWIKLKILDWIIPSTFFIAWKEFNEN